jgi:hypothetical protein
LGGLTQRTVRGRSRRDVDRKIIEIGGKLYTEPPKGRKRRRTIHPTRTPEGYALMAR